MLVMVDYTTRFPEAISLKNVTAPKVAEQLIKWVSRLGIPQGILTDQGKTFMSGVPKGVCKILKIKDLRTSVYHLQMDGLVERFNRTLKGMLQPCIQEDSRK